MTANNSIDPSLFLSQHLERAEPDLLRSMLKTFIEALMGAEADALCGAPYGARTDERVNSRNGYRARDWDTRAGTMDVAIPKLRSGSYFPDWLLERRRRAERALTTVVATCYLLGVSTRRMEKLVETLGITRLSKSQVSMMAKELDEQVADFRSRPLDAGPYAQTQEALRKISAVLAEAGTDLSHVVRARMYLIRPEHGEHVGRAPRGGLHQELSGRDDCRRRGAARPTHAR
jgi:hypothetical protein